MKRPIENADEYRFLWWENWGSPQMNPQYIRCHELKHKLNDYQHNPRWSENTVWCDICKIYRKYDCSD